MPSPDFNPLARIPSPALRGILTAYLQTNPKVQPDQLVHAAKHVQASSLRIAKDMDILWNLLDRAMIQSGVHLPIDTGCSILNIGCGWCQEALPLSAYFSTWGSPLSVRRTHLTGIDMREAELELARRRAIETRRYIQGVLKVGPPPFDLQFLYGDASEIHQRPDLGVSYNIVFFRHQNLWHDPQKWTRIYELALDKVQAGGCMILTSYFDKEHRLALQLIRSMKAEVRVSIRNMASRELDYPGKSVDRHVAIITPRTDGLPHRESACLDAADWNS